MSMHAVANAYGRALLSQLHARMLFLSIIPFILSVLLWGVLLFFGLQPMTDFIYAAFAEHDLFRSSGNLLASIGLGMLRTMVVPLLAMFLLLPLMILTALVFMGVAAMPAIVRHVGERHFAQLEKKQGGTWIGSVAMALSSFAIFLLVFLVTLPAYAFPPAALAVHVVLWGWLTKRVMAYDALVDHASAEERDTIMREHRWPLLVIGIVSGAAGALPGMVWVGGIALWAVLFPFLAALSIWIYVVIFIFTGLWFEYYCLQALSDLRAKG